MKPLLFGKDKTEIVKGIAILMMVCLHTFSSEASVSKYISILTVGGGNFEYLLAQACNPVGLFMVLSGYGLYLSYLKGIDTRSMADNMKQTVTRTIRMYIPWWITLMTAVLVMNIFGVWTRGEISLVTFFGNITAWAPSWNLAGWYIMPFVITSFLLNLIFPSFKKHSLIWLGLSMCIYFGMGKIYAHYWDNITGHRALLTFCRLSEFLFPMLLGAFAAKYRELFVNTIIPDRWLSVCCHIGIVSMFAVSMVLHKIPLYPFYCFVLVISIVNATYPRIVTRTLSFLGSHSLNIWFIHGYLISFAYKLGYSPIVYLAIVLLSVLISIGLNKISQPVMKLVQKI